MKAKTVESLRHLLAGDRDQEHADILNNCTNPAHPYYDEEFAKEVKRIDRTNK